MLRSSTLILFVFCCLSITTKAQHALTELKEYAEFQKLAAQPLNSNLGDLESVKLVYSFRDKKLYFINSHVYPFHFSFCSTYLGYSRTLEEFNTDNYGSESKREFLLANLNRNPGEENYFIDLSVFDQMPEESIVQLYEAIRAKSYIGNHLKVLLNTERLIELKPTLGKKIQVLLPAELYANKTFQEVSPGKCIGQLRFEPNLDSLKSPLLPTDILVTKGTPVYFPNVRGILIDEFQTPLSHLVILGRNRGIPIAVDKSVFQDTNFLKLNGEWIEFKVTDRRFYYSLARPSTGTENNRKTIELVVDTTICTLVPVKNFNTVGKDAIGNKAYNFGILDDLKAEGKFKTPESAYAIPFYFYLEHAKRSDIQPYLDQIYSLGPNEDDTLRSLLKKIRKAIKSTPVDPFLVSTIQQELKHSDFTTFRFRSSTNAEDAEGFSGAGLYDSKTVDLNDSLKTVEKGITDVWASLWTYEAFQERRFFNISDKNLAMGILIHRSFPEEEANGVVITKNVYRQNYPGISINVQFGDISVVQPPENVVCDQLVIVYEMQVSGFDRTVEYISNSSLGTGVPVMTEKELEQLEFAVEAVKQYYWNTKIKRYKFRSYENFGLDIEFKLQGEKRELYLKQVRIYNG